MFDDELETEIDPITGMLRGKEPKSQAFVQTSINRNLLYTKSEVDAKIAGSGGGGAVSSVNGQTGAVSLDSDDIPEGTTNLYSQWTTINETNLDNITPTNGQRLLIGSTANSTYFDTNFSAASAVFDGTSTDGTNYFMVMGHGSGGFINAGGTFSGVRSRGTAASPTQVLAGDYLMTVFPGAQDNSGNIVLHNDGTNVLSGMYFKAQENVTSGDFNLDIVIGSYVTEHITAEVRGATGNAVVINNSLLDTDFEVNYELGVAMFIDGSTGQTLLADGSAANPTMSFQNSTGTGAWLAASNTMNIGTGGAARIQFNNTGVTVNPGGGSATDFKVNGDNVNNIVFVDASTDGLGFFNATPVTQRTGDIKTGLTELGLFSSTSFVSEHRYLVTNAI